ncbi:unnamed protein product [Closterium sp. Naga37s-1]|nr:unnamed protein product [Closterium sp. Naga37s-1]
MFTSHFCSRFAFPSSFPCLHHVTTARTTSALELLPPDFPQRLREEKGQQAGGAPASAAAAASAAGAPSSAATGCCWRSVGTAGIWCHLVLTPLPIRTMQHAHTLPLVPLLPFPLPLPSALRFRFSMSAPWQADDWWLGSKGMSRLQQQQQPPKCRLQLDADVDCYRDSSGAIGVGRRRENVPRMTGQQRSPSPRPVTCQHRWGDVAERAGGWATWQILAIITPYCLSPSSYHFTSVPGEGLGRGPCVLEFQSCEQLLLRLRLKAQPLEAPLSAPQGTAPGSTSVCASRHSPWKHLCLRLKAQPLEAPLSAPQGTAPGSTSVCASRHSPWKHLCLRLKAQPLEAPLSAPQGTAPGSTSVCASRHSPWKHLCLRLKAQPLEAPLSVPSALLPSSSPIHLGSVPPPP